MKIVSENSRVTNLAPLDYPAREIKFTLKDRLYSKWSNQGVTLSIQLANNIKIFAIFKNRIFCARYFKSDVKCEVCEFLLKNTQKKRYFLRRFDQFEWNSLIKYMEVRSIYKGIPLWHLTKGNLARGVFKPYSKFQVSSLRYRVISLKI